MYNRVNFESQGRMVMNGNNNYYAMSQKPKFIMDYSTKKPSPNEITQASQSLYLLKRKMVKSDKNKNYMKRKSYTHSNAMPNQAQ